MQSTAILSSCSCLYYILWEFNIDFLKINPNSSVADFNHFTNCYGIHCLINKPTTVTDHSSTLLDHLYTSESTNTRHSGICKWDVNDHYPIFCIISLHPSHIINVKSYMLGILHYLRMKLFWMIFKGIWKHCKCKILRQLFINLHFYLKQL